MTNKLFGIDLSKSAESQFEKQPDFDLQNDISNDFVSQTSVNGKSRSGKISQTFTKEDESYISVKDKELSEDKPSMKERDVSEIDISYNKPSSDGYNL